MKNLLSNPQVSSTDDGIVRCLWSIAAPLPRRGWDVLSALDFNSPPAWETISDGSWLWRPGQGQALHIDSASWNEVGLADCPGLLARPGDQLPSGPARQRVTLELRRDPQAAYFGLGQRLSRMRRDPGVYYNWTVDHNYGHSKFMKSLYQAHPFLFVATSRGCQGIYLHTSFYNRFDVGEGKAEQISLQTLGGQAELYLLPGPTAAAVIEQLTRLTGRPLFPPLWALGHHQSRWGYREAAEIYAIIEEYRQRNLPLDVVHLDIDYMNDYRSFTFHPQRFPEPLKLADAARQQGVRLVSIIDPGIRFDLESSYEVARQGCLQGHFLKNADGSPLVGFCWPDSAVFTDYSSASARQWWGEQHRPLIEAGIAGIWNDMNEPAVFDRPFSQGLAEQKPFPLAVEHSEGATHAEVHNLYGHLMCRSTFEGLTALRPQERPFILTRSAGVGTQSFASSWMGDNNSWWEHLELTLGQLVNMGLSGSPWVGVDIGGFSDNCSGELLARWYEQGVFYPFMRNHTSLFTRPQEPWRFGGEFEAAVRRCLELRYRLLPYLYSLGHQAHRSGAPLLRPLFWEFERDEQSLHVDDQALLGPFLLIAPIVKSGVQHRSVYLPPGGWCNFWTQRFETGPAWIVDEAPLGQPILWLREGCLLPLGNVRQHTGQALEELIWMVFPGPRETVFQWVFDDGVTPAAPGEVEMRLTQEGISWSQTMPAPFPTLKRHHLQRCGQPEIVELAINASGTFSFS